jgi:neutral ceramidase
MVYVDMSQVALGDEVTHAGPQTTSPAAYGYSFAAGSTEDGGGQPMFREGMIRQDPLVDALARNLVPLPAASAEMRRGHEPKPILIALGAVDPPALPQVLPVGVARIGQLALAIGPAEFTTTSGRRFRRAVSEALPDVKYVAVAGYAGDYAGYVATREEYQVQHYEGAATLFGPWTQLAYQQQFARLAGDLVAGRKSETHDAPLDVRPLVRQTPLATAYDAPPPNGKFGDVVREPLDTYAAGEKAAATFWSGNPRNGYRPDRGYAIVERREGEAWLAVARDGDWEVKIRWARPNAGKQPAAPSGVGRGAKAPAAVQAANDQRLAAHEFTVEWAVPADARSGTYRVSHHGVYKDEAQGKVHEFTSASRPFEIAASAAPATDPSPTRK